MIAMALRQSEELARQQQLEEEQLAWALKDSLEIHRASQRGTDQDEVSAKPSIRCGAAMRSGGSLVLKDAYLQPIAPVGTYSRTADGRSRIARCDGSLQHSTYVGAECNADAGIRPPVDNPARQRRRRMQTNTSTSGAEGGGTCATQDSSDAEGASSSSQPTLRKELKQQRKGGDWLPPPRAPRPVVTAKHVSPENPSWSLPELPPPAILFDPKDKGTPHRHTPDFPPVLVWFRSGDLRLADNPALYEAAQRQAPVIPVYIEPPLSEQGGWPVRAVWGGSGVG